MTVAEAGRYLGVSKAKMARLIADGVLHPETDMLDKRVKRIPRRELDTLKPGGRHPEEAKS